MSRKYSAEATREAVQTMVDSTSPTDEAAKDAMDIIVIALETLHEYAQQRNDILEAVACDVAGREDRYGNEYIYIDDFKDQVYHCYTNDDGVLEPIDELEL